MSVSKRTIKRILHRSDFSWRRVRKKPKGRPDPKEYAQKKEELESLEEQAENLYYPYLCYQSS